MPLFSGSGGRVKDVLDQNMKFRCYLRKMIFAQTEKQLLQFVKNSVQFVLLTTYFDKQFFSGWQMCRGFCVMFEECSSSQILGSPTM